MKTLLIVYYSYTGGTAQMVEAAAAAGQGEDGTEVRMMRAEECEPAHMLAADGYIFAMPENLAAIAGVMKAFFDRCYYPLLGAIEGRPYAVMICAGSDGENAKAQSERIAKGWRLKKVVDSLIVCTHAQTEEEILAQKTIGSTDLAKCAEIGATLSAGLAMRVF
ncbi:flavodoxin family protein [Parasphingorhabdus sp.]|uniref:flavodoxin family protein n=1 Tax=Parasphingorhabdus sp. TaxID=2709688 RepID=UPI003A91EBA4